MSRKKLGGSFWIVRNLGFERIVKLRGLYWIGGNLEGRFRLSETLEFSALRNFGVLCWGVRKLGIYAHEKLGVCNRGICETSGCIRGNFGGILLCGCGVCVGCSFCKFFAFFLFGIRAFWGLLSG